MGRKEIGFPFRSWKRNGREFPGCPSRCLVGTVAAGIASCLRVKVDGSANRIIARLDKSRTCLRQPAAVGFAGLNHPGLGPR